MSRKYQKLIIALLILLIPFSLLFIKIKAVDSIKRSVFERISLSVRFISTPIREIKKLIFYHKVFDEYVKLKSEVESLRTRLIGQEEVLRENNRYKGLLDFKRSSVFSSVAANVIGRDPSNWQFSFVISKGENNGIKVGMPVINSSGVIGKIVEVSAKTSRVITLLDPSFSVPGLVQRSREVGLVNGTLQDVCRMRYLSTKADVRVGDKVITSRLSSSFPESLLIGEVVKVEVSQESPSIQCYIRPAVSFTQIEEVLVIQKE